VIDVERLAEWLDNSGTAGKGEPIEVRYVSGGSQNEIYEIRRGELHGALRIPPPTFGPIVPNNMKDAADLAESTDYGR
jgi:hypothetical protein